MRANQDEDAPQKQASGASSLDPHLHPPPKHGGGSRRWSEAASLSHAHGANGNAKSKTANFHSIQRLGGPSLSPTPRRSTSSTPPHASQARLLPFILIRAAAHRLLDSKTNPGGALLTAPARRRASSPESILRTSASRRFVPPSRRQLSPVPATPPGSPPTLFSLLTFHFFTDLTTPLSGRGRH